jgi:sterol desaturase/sphingolipid hydroxylase (fatty acid hydroxylase superfamily)
MAAASYGTTAHGRGGDSRQSHTSDTAGAPRLVGLNRLLSEVFGAHGQIVVGVLMVAMTVLQAWYWGIQKHPGSAAIFWLSVEALLFAAYGVFATALGYRATERVEQLVVENVENVEVGRDS